ncbi:TPA: hypothetical protein QH079_001973 [Enterobacter roggenkampii]|nr:hypothetical protein [Enterobacter roggenkampii]
MSSDQEQTINQLRSDISNLTKALELVNERLNKTQNELYAYVLVLSSGLTAMDESTKERARVSLASTIEHYPEGDKDRPEFLDQASEIAKTVFVKHG